MDLLSQFKIDRTLQVVNFLTETTNLLRPNTYGSFKELFWIVTKSKHYVTVNIKENTIISSFIPDLDSQFDLEILENIDSFDLFEHKRKYYYRFLNLQLKENIDSISLIINDFKKSEFIEKLKNDLLGSFLSLEWEGFFSKETLVRKKINEELDPYARPLTDEEFLFFKGIFENYFTEWFSQLKNYFDLFHRIEFVFNMYAKPVTPTPKTVIKEDIEEDLAEPRTLNSILILLDKIGFFQLPQVEQLGENKKGELIAFLTKYKESFCKVTIKEMSKSSSADGRNNPYNSDKAIKDANNFLTKLNK